MLPSVRALLTGTIDYAGLFPPAQLEMPETVLRYRRHAAGGDGWLLARLVVPAARLGELAPLLGEGREGQPPIRLAVLARATELSRDLADVLSLPTGTPGRPSSISWSCGCRTIRTRSQPRSSSPSRRSALELLGPSPSSRHHCSRAGRNGCAGPSTRSPPPLLAAPSGSRSAAAASTRRLSRRRWRWPRPSRPASVRGSRSRPPRASTSPCATSMPASTPRCTAS